ncbi:MAG: DedA family protein [Egibacteraceae bacterium]
MTEWATEALRAAGPLGLALMMLLETVFPPIPSEILLPFGGFLVSTGAFGFAEALIAATVGSTGGAVLLYGLSRYGGRPLLLRWHRVLRLEEKDLDRADDWFDRYGWIAVLFGRMLPIVRSVVSVPAGVSEMPAGRFVVLTAVGSTSWNTLLIGAGFALGERYDQVSAVVSRYSLLAPVLLALAAAAWWWRHRRAARRS